MDNRYCHSCGAPFSQTLAYPRVCVGCRIEVWENPKPVGVLLMAVYDEERRQNGLLVGKRGHNPGLGKWGLPGGFVELNENLETGAVRELYEETGLVVNVDHIRLFYSDLDSSGKQVLAFSYYTGPIMTLAEVKKSFVPCAECPEIKLIYEPETLAFPTHTHAAARFFAFK